MGGDAAVGEGPSLCCVPVSWPTGFGELARQLTLASAARQRWPNLRCHFILNRHLPAAVRGLLPPWSTVSWLDTSPTEDDGGVTAALDRCRPAVVLFDNAGSGRQCRHARRLGARTVFLSTRQRTLARGFGRDWLRWLDEHWIVGPRALADPLSASHRLRAALCGIRLRRPQALFAPCDAERAAGLRRALVVGDQPYVCFVPGGGGGLVDGRAAAAIFADAAAIVARRAAAPCLLLLGPLFTGADPERPGVTIHHATHVDTVDLMADARAVVLGASSSLFQALAQGRVCVASAAGGSEQLARAHAWAARGVVVAAEPQAEALAGAVCDLLADRARWDALRQRVEALAVENDLPLALSALGDLLGDS